MKPLFAPAALSFAALLAMQGILPAQEPAAAPPPSEVIDDSHDLPLAFDNAAMACDLATMKAKYAELQASDPKSKFLPDFAFQITMVGKDWPVVKKGLENLPAGEKGNETVRTATAVV